jgi:YD repeat-containing protein
VVVVDARITAITAISVRIRVYGAVRYSKSPASLRVKDKTVLPESSVTQFAYHDAGDLRTVHAADDMRWITGIPNDLLAG